MFQNPMNDHLDIYSDSSDDNITLADLNLSMTSFTGVNGSFDDLENQIFNKLPNYTKGSICSVQTTINPFKLSRSSSMDFNSDNPNSPLGANLPLAKSLYQFNLNSNTKLSKTVATSKSQSKNISLCELSTKQNFTNSNIFSFNGSDDDSNESYDAFICKFQPYMINPKQSGFLPQDIWPDRELSLDQIVTNFFQIKPLPSTNRNIPCTNLIDTQSNLLRKNALNLEIKLYNALKISEITPLFENLVGVSWFQCKNTHNEIIKINMSRFSKLVDFDVFIKDSHSDRDILSYLGFKEMTMKQISSLDEDADLSGIDLIEVKLIYQPEHKFHKNSTMNDILSLK